MRRDGQSPGNGPPKARQRMPSFSESRAGGRRAARPEIRRGDAWRYPLVGVMVSVSFDTTLGRGIVTSSTPSCVRALIFFASTPSGSCTLREKLP